MTPFEQQFEELGAFRARFSAEKPTYTKLANGSHLIVVPDVDLPTNGWNRSKTTILFVAPPGYPASQPDCFWVEPSGFRLANLGTPQASNDANPIPGDIVSRSTTWFSWHLQSWNPNHDSLVTYFNVIQKRLFPAR